MYHKYNLYVNKDHYKSPSLYMRYKYNSQILLHLYFSTMEKTDVWPSGPSPFWCKQTAHLQFCSCTYQSPGGWSVPGSNPAWPFDTLVIDKHPVAPYITSMLSSALYRAPPGCRALAHTAALGDGCARKSPEKGPLKCLFRARAAKLEAVFWDRWD